MKKNYISNLNLSERLLFIAKKIDSNDIILDVGSDHGYLPIYLVGNKIVKKAYCNDINERPFNRLKDNINSYNLNSLVIPSLSDGISNVDKEVNTLVFSGIGDSLITKILNNNLENLININKMVFAPNNNNFNLRQWIMDNSYKIIEEEIVIDNNLPYEIIVVIKTNKKVKYNTKDLLFGPLLRKEKSLSFQLKWVNEFKKLDRINLNKLPQDKLVEITQTKKEILKIIKP